MLKGVLGGKPNTNQFMPFVRRAAFFVFIKRNRYVKITACANWSYAINKESRL